METAAQNAARLKLELKKAEDELKRLKGELARAEAASSECSVPENEVDSELGSGTGWRRPLKAEEYERYARQIILPSVGIKGQLRLNKTSILIVGAGGLGCPAAAYIAGAGVGTLGIVDGDVVEASNLHRQIAHATSRIGMSKVDSLITYLNGLNPLPTYRAHKTHLTPTNAASIVSQYDLVLDCTDHPTSRYLISDICVLLGKPLVSASALKTDGQLIVLNCPARPVGDESGGPCYRCVFPKPPPPDSVVSCGEGGILGPVVGTMGVLMACEAIRLVASGRAGAGVRESALNPAIEGEEQQKEAPSMLLFSAGVGPPSFRSVRMRGRRRDCFACSAASTLTLDTLASGSLDYVAFCGVTAPVQVLQPEERVSVMEYQKLVGGKQVLLDVREKELFDMGSIDGAINVPYSKIQAESRSSGGEAADEAGPSWLPKVEVDAPIYVVCRVGNDSQMVARQLKMLGLDKGGERFIGDVKGGMRAWKDSIDQTLPFA